MRILQEPGFVLHSYKYRESSLIVEVLTRHHGRLSLLAKGARRWKKRGANIYLRPFQRLLLSWAGKGELATLTGAEEVPPIGQFGKQAVYCGFYMNELMIHFLHKHDPHEDLFDFYQVALSGLTAGENSETVLRIFEKRLLNETGYGMNLEVDFVTGKPIEPTMTYSYIPNQGPAVLGQDKPSGQVEQVSGRSLIALREEQLDVEALRELKGMMRRIIDQRLNHKPLVSRSMFTRKIPASGVTAGGSPGQA
jgi:DNA repair protein RecO (recombination protein O)